MPRRAALGYLIGRGALMGRGELIGTGDLIGRGSLIGAGEVIGRGPLKGASGGTGRFGLKKGMARYSSIVRGGKRRAAIAENSRIWPWRGRGVRKSQPSDETRARPDFDVLAVLERPGFGDSFFIGLGNQPQQQVRRSCCRTSISECDSWTQRTLFRP